MSPRPWASDEFAAFIADPATVLCSEAGGVALGRVAADEAELLTIAVEPYARRRGVGRGLLLRFLAAAQARGARRVVLEVAADNVDARALYAAAGFVECARRPAYYRMPGGAAVDAVLMARDRPVGQ